MGVNSSGADDDEKDAGPEGDEGQEAGADGIGIGVRPYADLGQHNNPDQWCAAEDEHSEPDCENPIREIVFHPSPMVA